MVNVIIPPHAFSYSEAATILIGVLILGLHLSHYNVLSSHKLCFKNWQLRIVHLKYCWSQELSEALPLDLAIEALKWTP